MAYCEDYPACGHTQSDPCGRSDFDLVQFHYERMSKPDYDPYYDDFD